MLYHHDLPDCQKKEIPLLKRHAAGDLLPAAYTISIIKKIKSLPPMHRILHCGQLQIAPSVNHVSISIWLLRKINHSFLKGNNICAKGIHPDEILHHLRASLRQIHCIFRNISDAVKIFIL